MVCKNLFPPISRRENSVQSRYAQMERHTKGCSQQNCSPTTGKWEALSRIAVNKKKFRMKEVMCVHVCTCACVCVHTRSCNQSGMSG